MTYFGGLGAGKGWLKLYFLVEPEVLRDVLDEVGAILVITDRRVLADYESTALDEYIASYARYVGAMLESSRAAQRAAEDVSMGLTRSLEKFEADVCRDTRYKLWEPHEPIPHLSPETIDYNEVRRQLTLSSASSLYFGLELSFPRVYSVDRDDHEVMHDTAESDGRALFDAVKSRLQAVTRSCKFLSPAKEHKTDIRITDGMRARMKEHPELRRKGLEVM